jgi:kynurenine 3-monooxygenase
MYLNYMKFIMSGNHLHIWPRGDFMMIALPNDDNTFTGNLFAPFKTLEALDTPEHLLQFYRDNFPDGLRLIGEEKLVKDFFQTSPKTLLSIKVDYKHMLFNFIAYISYCSYLHTQLLFSV